VQTEADFAFLESCMQESLLREGAVVRRRRVRRGGVLSRSMFTLAWQDGISACIPDDERARLGRGSLYEVVLLEGLVCV
jgi:hypothetical protein